MTDRFTPSRIWNAHIKGLKNRVYTSARPIGRPDKVARIALYALPVVAAVAMVAFDGTVAGGEGILAAAGIFSGAFFMGFTQVATWRERFTERRDQRDQSEVHQRDSLDESVAHLLMAIYASIGLAVVLVVGQNFADEKDRLTGVWAAISAGLGLYLVLLIMIVLPKLYTAYAGINEVDDEMSGLHRG